MTSNASRPFSSPPKGDAAQRRTPEVIDLTGDLTSDDGPPVEKENKPTSPETDSRPPKRRRPGSVPNDWPHTVLGLSYLAVSQEWDVANRLAPGERQSYFPGTQLTKDSGRTLTPGQWRHIRATYAFARLLFDEDEILAECFRIPLGYIHQLLLHDTADSTAGVANPTSLYTEMEDARADVDVLPSFPGTPLIRDQSRPLSPEQLNHVEDTYKGLVEGMGSLSPEAFGGPGIELRDYCYVLGLLEQLIHHIRGNEDEG